MFNVDKMIRELSKPNDYYDRCYGCNHLGTDGWGDELCTDCKEKQTKMFADLGVWFDENNEMHRIESENK